MFQRNHYAPKNYSISYDEGHEKFILCCPKHEFTNPENIPACFEKVPNVEDVYRMVVPAHATASLYDDIKTAFRALIHADEIIAQYDDYLPKANHTCSPRTL